MPDNNAITAAVLSIAEAIQSVERADDRALAELGRLFAATAEARADTNLASDLAQKPLEAMFAQIEHRLAGRRAIASIHGSLGGIAVKLGATPQEWGPSWPCPNGRVSSEPVVSLVKAA